MAGDEEVYGSLTLRFHRSKRGGYIKATTWGLQNGQYASLGVVRIPASSIPKDATVGELAPVVLAALYGLDYDL